MGTIYLSIAILAIVVTGISEYRRFLKSQGLKSRVVFSKKGKK
jgi:hypothetical protein